MMKFLAFAMLLLLSGCASTIKSNNALITRLNNRGPVALSSDNPFLAANLLLSREMEMSPEVKGFIQHRGAPSALEIVSHYSAPLLMYFYYPENRESYNFEFAEGAWIISGPNSIPKERLKALSILTRNISGEPMLVDNSEKPPPPQAPPQIASDPEPQRRRVIAPPSQPIQKPIMSDDAQELEARIEALTKNESKHWAEISPRGDVVHYVTYPGETLSVIARWYTYDRDNAPRIARINGLNHPDQLGIGDSVIIPGYLVKNKQRLTPEGLQMLKNVGTKTRG